MKRKLIVRTLPVVLIAGIAVIMLNGCGTSAKKQTDMTQEFKDFVAALEKNTIPLLKEMNLASFNANVSGKEEDYKKSADLEIKITKIFSNKSDFEKLKKIKESNTVTDEILKRELDVLYNEFLSNQMDEKMLEDIIKLQSGIESKFNTFRAEIKGKKMSDNEVETILKTSTNSDELKETWEGSKKVGEVVSADIIKLVKMRNEVAKKLGFSNFYEMSLKLSEQEPKDIDKTFDELDSLTRNSFTEVKGEIDDYFAKLYKVKKEDLMPWHYQNRYFQEAPKIYKVDLDVYFKGKDVVEITKDYYKSIGMDITDMVAKSDLYEKPGKYQHAMSTNIDKEGDIRVLGSVKNNYYWMNTMMHEFGHSVYDKYIDHSLPYYLRDPAHTFTTEAIAEMFGRMASNPQWLKDVMKISDKEKEKISEDCFKTFRMEQLVFSRWSQVMYRFEKGLYSNPDQDLNKLWWDLVEKYQMIKRPEGRNAPDWASKIHIATSPCYYHNYLLGEMLASQLYYYITEKILKSTDFKNQSFYGKPEVGKYLIDKIFKPGDKYYWNDMIEKATGEKLTAKYYAKQFTEK
jgi:peptidyl-dipeptidase A